MKRFAALSIVAAVLFGFCAVAHAESARQELVKDSTIEKVLKRGVLRVGFDTFVPWAMKNKDGKYIGFEIDVATRLARDMGVKVEFVPTKWSGIIPALLTDKFDVIIGGMGILPERNLKVNFTIPYYASGMSLFANKEKAKGFDSLEDFNNPDVVLALRMAATPRAAVKKHMPRAQVRLFDNEPQAVQEVLNGRAHAMVSSAPLPAHMVIQHPDKLFLPIEGTFTREPIGFAVRKGDVDTLNFFNNWIRVTQAGGWIEERHHYWFETRDWAGQIR
ncbi:MAG: transporter substrate-binding domain-containing protein [Desulfatibacillaceae bacterium]